jgi:hypothetical protein
MFTDAWDRCGRISAKISFSQHAQYSSRTEKIIAVNMELDLPSIDQGQKKEQDCGIQCFSSRV